MRPRLPKISPVPISTGCAGRTGPPRALAAIRSAPPSAASAPTDDEPLPAIRVMTTKAQQNFQESAEQSRESRRAT
ncbi:hypothetical protein AQ611_09445 [Burkholderia singularis]|nr:hypothetical protein AQ611_09445 [Burkholderia sp. Bp7605]